MLLWVLHFQCYCECYIFNGILSVTFSMLCWVLHCQCYAECYIVNVILSATFSMLCWVLHFQSYTECYILIVILTVVRLSVVMQSVVAPWVRTLWITLIEKKCRGGFWNNLQHINKFSNTKHPFVFQLSWDQCYKTFYGHILRIFIISLSFCPWQAFPA